MLRSRYQQAVRIMDSGFVASAWQRMAVALVVIGMAAGLVVVVEYPRLHHATVESTSPAAPQRRTTVRLESSFPVGTWLVSVAGVMIPAVHSDTSTWQGVIEGAPGAEILIEAIGTAMQVQRGAVRVVVDGDPHGERSAWGEGHVIITARVP